MTILAWVAVTVAYGVAWGAVFVAIIELTS